MFRNFSFVHQMVVWMAVVAITLSAAVLLTRSARSEAPNPAQCPTDAPCKVLTLTDQELQALTGPNMILDTAQQGRPLDLAGVVTYFRNKIQTAPAGTPPAAVSPPKPAPSSAPEAKK